MKKFQFKLETVLTYRREQVDLVRQTLAEQERTRRDILQRIAEFDQIISSAMTEQKTRMNDGDLDIKQAQHFPNYLFRLKEFRFQEYQQLQKQDQIILETRNVLKQAMIKQKALEVLKDKEHQRFLKAIDKAEEEILADLVMGRLAGRQQANNKQTNKQAS